eukprot:scaffold43200_cov69-Phaeocystis_antarctica.AAC.3
MVNVAASISEAAANAPCSRASAIERAIPVLECQTSSSLGGILGILGSSLDSFASCRAKRWPRALGGLYVGVAHIIIEHPPRPAASSTQ